MHRRNTWLCSCDPNLASASIRPFTIALFDLSEGVKGDFDFDYVVSRCVLRQERGVNSSARWKCVLVRTLLLRRFINKKHKDMDSTFRWF